MELDRYLSQARDHDRKVRRRHEEEFIQLIRMIKAQLAHLREQDQEAELEDVD